MAIPLRKTTHRRTLADVDLRALLQLNSTEAMAVHDTAGNIRFLSPAARNILGPPDDLIGRRLDHLASPEHQARVRRSFLHFSPERPTRKITYQLATCDGSRWVETTVRADYHDGCLIEIHSATRDIHRFREIEQRLCDFALAQSTEARGSRDEIERLHESLGRIRALAARQQAQRDAYRAAIGREIHDELGHRLTALQLELGALRRQFEDQSMDAEPIDRLIDSVGSTCRAVSHIASFMRPIALDQLGLRAALDAQMREFRRRTGIEGSLSLPERPLDLTPQMELAVFRILQEILTNVARHAQASEVVAGLSRSERGVRLEVRDDGCGFDPAMAAPEGLGLLGMHERAILLGGSLTVSSAPDQGTAVCLTLPL